MGQPLVASFDDGVREIGGPYRRPGRDHIGILVEVATAGTHRAIKHDGGSIALEHTEPRCHSTSYRVRTRDFVPGAAGNRYSTRRSGESGRRMQGKSAAPTVDL